jgi:hypothetical protein
METELESLRGALADADLYMRDPEAFDSASRRYAVVAKELENAEIRWLELEELSKNQ